MTAKHDTRMEQDDNSAYNKYSSYVPYAGYTPYSRAVEAASLKQRAEIATRMKMDKVNVKKDMMTEEDGTAVEDKRDMDHPDASETAGSTESRADGTLPNNWYGKYE